MSESETWSRIAPVDPSREWTPSAYGATSGTAEWRSSATTRPQRMREGEGGEGCCFALPRQPSGWDTWSRLPRRRSASRPRRHRAELRRPASCVPPQSSAAKTRIAERHRRSTKFERRRFERAAAPTCEAPSTPPPPHGRHCVATANSKAMAFHFRTNQSAAVRATVHARPARRHRCGCLQGDERRLGVARC